MPLSLVDLQATIADQRLKMPATHLQFLDSRLLQTPEAVVLKSGMLRDSKEYNGWVIAKDAQAEIALIVSESPWVADAEWFFMSYTSLKRLSFKDCRSAASLAQLIDDTFELNELFSSEQWETPALTPFQQSTNDLEELTTARRDDALQAPFTSLRELFHENTRAVVASQPVQDRLAYFNELAAALSPEATREIVWDYLLSLTAGDPADEIDSELIIAVFELLAEPPDVPDLLTLLFSIESQPRMKWIIFAAHRRWPRLFRKHIAQYSKGAITHEEYVEWLGECGLKITNRGLRFDRG